MAHTMYSMLMRLPLFQGMSQSELFEVLEQVAFHFHKAEEGKVVARQGESCDKLTFLMSGQLEAKTEAPHARFSLSEVLVPCVTIEPQSLFGKYPSYKSTYTALSEVSLLSIDKRHIYTLLSSYEVFRINFFSLLGSKIENLHARQWAISPQTLEGRLAYFIYNLCTTPQGAKTLHVKMEELAQLLNTTRLNVSNVLNNWKEEGFIAMRRKEFVIHDISRLIEKALH